MEVRDFWAKTCRTERQALSVRDHCIHVGRWLRHFSGVCHPCCGRTSTAGRRLGSAARYRKISRGFQVKCAQWIAEHGLAEHAWRSDGRPSVGTDHAKVSQAFLQGAMTPAGTSRGPWRQGCTMGGSLAGTLPTRDLRRRRGLGNCRPPVSAGRVDRHFRPAADGATGRGLRGALVHRRAYLSGGLDWVQRSVFSGGSRAHARARPGGGGGRFATDPLGWREGADGRL